MSDIELTPMSTLPRILSLSDGPQLEAGVEARVHELWQRAVRERGAALTDRPIFSVVDELRGEMTGRFVSYRYYLAQHLDSTLQTRLRVRPLAVTGIVRCAEGVVIGRRTATATQGPESWDFLPSGGVDADSLRPDGSIDAELQVLRELKEELGIELPSEVRPRPRWRMCEGEVIDLVFGIDVALDAREVAERFSMVGPREHTEIQIVDPASLARDGAGSRSLSATCRVLLRALARGRPAASGA
jgi:hypothetical protein